jgi:inosose dehydratase
LAAAKRGKQPAIAGCHCAIGDGIKGENIKKCLAMLHDHGFRGVLSMECDGDGGPMIEWSLKWLRGVLAELKIPLEG